MPVSTSTTRYSSSVIALHWLMLVLIAAGYACIELRELFEKGTPMRDGLKTVHFSLGITILALVIVRIVARLTSPTPAIIPEPPALQALAAKLVHLALYALMLGMPILGWLILSGEAKAIPYFGLFNLPPLMGPDKELAETIEEIHEIGGKIGYALIAIHAAAAIYHHRIVGDNTVLRMMPEKKQQA